MRRKVVVLVALALGGVSVAGLARAVASARPPAEPLDLQSNELAGEFARFGQAARGRRVLVVSAPPGRPPVAGIHEAARAPEGWRPYSGSPPGASDFAAALDALAAACGPLGADLSVPSSDQAHALELFAVKGIVSAVPGQPGRSAPFERADPVLRLDGAEPGADAALAASDPLRFAAALAWTPAKESAGWTFSDETDELWGGGVTVDTTAAGRFVFPYPAKGGTVTVDGRRAERAAVGPLLALDLPAGRSRVEVTFVGHPAGQLTTVLSAAGLVTALMMLLGVVRPSRTAVEAAADADAEAPR